MNRKWICNLAGILFLVMASCMYPLKKFTEKRLVIANKQSVRIEELDMTITNNGCGRKWLTDHGAERPYCDIIVKIKDSTWHFGDSFDPLYIRNLRLSIDKMNPSGREEDSIPPGGCRIIVTKLDDLSR